MATVVCNKCQRPAFRSFRRGYRLSEDRCVCGGPLRRFNTGKDRFWEPGECHECWPPVRGMDKGIVATRQWSGMSCSYTGPTVNHYCDIREFECPKCHATWKSHENHTSETEAAKP